MSASPGSERRSLLEVSSLEEAGEIVDKFVSKENEEIIDISRPEMFLFQTAGIFLELAACALLVYLGFMYLLAGCWITGAGVLALGASAGYLSVPQLAKPFIKNPLYRWFIVSNHSVQITAMASILGGFLFLTYFSWFNSYHGKRVIRDVSTSAIAVIGVDILSFFIACYRNENGNGGYIRWALKLVF